MDTRCYSVTTSVRCISVFTALFVFFLNQSTYATQQIRSGIGNEDTVKSRDCSQKLNTFLLQATSSNCVLGEKNTAAPSQNAAKRTLRWPRQRTGNMLAATAAGACGLKKAGARDMTRKHCWQTAKAEKRKRVARRVYAYAGYFAGRLTYA
ncbi:hypothetical protein NPIL_372121 [Nephila pilipes]|uniref:Uncharacterized protein n=1 Tax=Nephila pilipes TaxID=299642 RepID=A0A8X6N3W3_NEPPI|nr:hypothetical protein NPIL_372121 [Nephila pilipes]